MWETLITVLGHRRGMLSHPARRLLSLFRHHTLVPDSEHLVMVVRLGRMPEFGDF